MRGTGVGGAGAGGNIGLGSFTIKPTIKEIRTSTPTNSSAVTEAGSTSTFTVRLGQAPSGNVTVAVSVSDTSEASISPNSLSFTSTNYNTTQTVTVTGKDDSIFDGTQSYNVVLNPSSTADSDYNGLSDVNVAMTTTDDESAPRISINSPSVTEGDSGSTNLTFTVSMSLASASQHTVNYASSDGITNGATAGTDYTAVSGTLTFAAGETSKTVAVSVTGDTVLEENETMAITLSNATGGASIATVSGIGTIVNDDRGFLINSPSVVEGDSDSVNLTFTVTLKPAATVQMTVNYADAGSGSATSGTDYTAIAGGTLTFAAGETSKTIAVSVTGDTSAEMNETVVIALSNATGGASIVTARGTGTITDNDIPGFSIDSPSVAEGDSGSTNLVFTVSLSPASYQETTVNYADAGSGTATSGTDYATIASGTLTFATGETSKTITVSVTGDTVFEPDEMVVIMLSNASSGTSIGTASGTGTIADNDDTPGFSIDSPSVAEGDSGSTNLTFTVSLNQASYQQATVNYADAGTGTAVSGGDYAAVASGMLTFMAGETSKTIDVSVLGDVRLERDETIVLTLSSPNPSYPIVVSSGTGTIMDNDASVLAELDTEIVGEFAREITTSVLTAVSGRTAAVSDGASVAPPGSEFANDSLISILERVARHSRERDRGLLRSELSLYRSLDGASFVYSPRVSGLAASAPDDASKGGVSGDPTVWGSVDYSKLSGGGANALKWNGELAAVNIGTDTMVESGVLVGLAAGVSKGSFDYQGSTDGTAGTIKLRMKTLNPYVGWALSESASLWAAVGYGKGKINYNDDTKGEVSSRMSLTSVAMGGLYRLLSADGSAGGRLVQVDLKGEVWGLQTKIEEGERRPTGSKSQAHGMRVAIERHHSNVLESGASLILSGEAGLRWDGGDGDTGTGFEMGGSADYGNSVTGMKLVATARALVDHESDRKNWGAGLTAGYRLDSRETGLTYRSSLSHGQPESGVDSLWDTSSASRASKDKELATRLEAEVGYRLFGMSGLHTPYAGFGAETGGTRGYRIGMRYANESAVSSGLEFERLEAGGKRPDHRVMLTGQMNW